MPSSLAASPARAACTPVYEVQPIQFVDDIEELVARHPRRAAAVDRVGRLGGLRVQRPERAPALAAVRFTGSSVRISLLERDSGEGTSDDALGTVNVTAISGAEATAPFSGSGYSYALVYRIVFVENRCTPDPLRVDLLCESASDYRITCSEGTTGGTAPYTVRWYINGYHYGGLDTTRRSSRAASRTGSTPSR